MKRCWFNFKQTSLLLVALVVTFMGSACTLNAFEQAEEEPAALPMPKPELTPDEVVRIQLESLQQNDDTNKGIATAFNFASPGNKKFTGPLERFIKMLQTPPYNSMLNYKSVEYDPVEINGDTALQRVKLIGIDGHSTIYIFQLSKQTQAPYQDCWMTDSVMIEPSRDLPKGQA